MMYYTLSTYTMDYVVYTFYTVILSSSISLIAPLLLHEVHEEYKHFSLP